MANVNIELGYKPLVWFTANPTIVLLAGQIVYLEQTGTYKIGDGVTQLSLLNFLGISSETQTLQNVTDLGNTTTNDIQFDAGVGVLLDNTSRLREGTIDAGYGGAKGIAQICAVGYELKWESGSLYVMDGNGTHIRHSLYNFSSVPSITEDITKGFLVGTRWSLDNGDVYVCSDNSIGAAVWVLQSNGTPTLGQVLASGSTNDGYSIQSNGFLSYLDINDAYIDLLVAGGSTELYMDAVSVALTTVTSIALDAPSVTKNSVEIATVNDIPTKTSELINDGDDGNPFISLNDLPSNLILYATTAASDIPTYVKLVNSITDIDYNTTAVDVSTGSITTTNQFISALITSPNVIVGNPGVINISTIGNIRRTAGTGNAEFYFEVYKRTIGGVETLITTSGNTIPVINTGYAEFSATALWNDGIFLATDRIVLKFYGSRIVGGSNPTYDFQFGGSTPVRSLVPIPLTVSPVLTLDNLQDVTIASVANNEILTFESSTSLWKNKTVTTALGFTPYDATNPSGYITSSALTGLVPYTGATANVNLGTFTLTTPTINGVSGLLSFKTTDRVSVGNYATPSAQRIFTVGQDTAFISMGSLVGSTSFSALYMNNTATPSGSNYTIRGSASDTILNCPSQMYLSRSGNIFMTYEFGMRTTWNMLSNPFGYVPFNITKNAVTGATASTPLLGWNYLGGSTQWPTGNITTQNENVWGATTYSFVGASTITNAYGNVFNAPIAGTNCTITNRFAALFNQQISLTQTVTTETVVQTRTVTIVINGVTYKLLAA